MLQAPQQQTLLHAHALLLRQIQQRLVLVQRRVRAAEARVTRAVDVLLLAVGDELRGRVVGVQLDLVDGRRGFGVFEQDLEVLDGEVGDADVLDFAGARQLFELGPGLLEVPVGEVLLGVGGVGGGGPVHEVARGVLVG
jgi:hypothetical protein